MTFICDNSYNCIPYECSSEVFLEQLSEYFENLENAQIRNCDEILTLNSYLITFLLIGLSAITYNYSLIERQLNFYRKKYEEFMDESDSEDNLTEDSEDDQEDQSDDSENQSDDTVDQSDDLENQSDDPENRSDDTDEDLVKVSDSEKEVHKTTRSGWFY